MAEKFKNPPLIEALCEFRFKENKSWDWTVPGTFYEKIKETFPNKEQKKAFEIVLESKDGKIIPAKTTDNEKKDKIVFLNEKKNAVIQVGPNTLSINYISDYSGWEAFKSKIDKYLKIYLDVSGSEIERIGLRYINRFDGIDVKGGKFGDYFNFGPSIPIKQPIKNFFIRNEMVYQEIDSILLLNMGTPPEKQNNVIVLDFDFITANEDNIKNVTEWVESAHEYIEEAFNACITEKTRRVMRGEETL